MNSKQLRNHLQELCYEAGSVMAWAKKHKVSHSYVSAVIRGDRPAGDKVLKALKMKKAYCFLSKGQEVTMKFEDITN